MKSPTRFLPGFLIRKTKRILRFLLFLTLAGLISFQPLQAEKKNIRVGIYDNNPLIFINQQGEAQGLFTDIINYIGEKEGWRLEYIHGTWPEMMIHPFFFL